MKDFLLATLTIALSAAVSYCIFAFAMYEFDAGKWPTDVRVLCLFMAFGFVSVTADHYKRRR